MNVFRLIRFSASLAVCLCVCVWQLGSSLFLSFAVIILATCFIPPHALLLLPFSSCLSHPLTLPSSHLLLTPPFTRHYSFCFLFLPFFSSFISLTYSLFCYDCCFPLHWLVLFCLFVCLCLNISPNSCLSSLIASRQNSVACVPFLFFTLHIFLSRQPSSSPSILRILPSSHSPPPFPRHCLLFPPVIVKLPCTRRLSLAHARLCLPLQTDVDHSHCLSFPLCCSWLSLLIWLEVCG